MSRTLSRAAQFLFALAILACTPAGAQPQRGEWVALPQPASQQLAEHRRISAALDSLKPQRPGVVDAYVIVIALDGDPVFSREAREAGRVLASRFDAVGRTIVLANDEGAAKSDALGSPHTLALALARVAELMDRNEDVLVLYSTSHGVPNEGLVYKDQQRGVGIVSPARLTELLDPLGFKNRLLILQACYSGQFVPALRGPQTVVVTAAAEDRSSFGCQAGNDWTLFGDALINHAMRQPLPLDVQLRRATALISAAEEKAQLPASNPQISEGSDTSGWLSALDARQPKVASVPVGAPIPGLGI
ncbi:MAG TPA: C13 family peptidase [Sphingomicrobium sp.]|nr:C13 family peptidase [Sphingomicrobium sp.]